MAIGSARAKQLMRSDDMSTAKKSDRPQFILLTGDTATGKTTSVKTLAKLGKVELWDLDQNADGLIGHENITRHQFGGPPGTDPESYSAIDWHVKDSIARYKKNPEERPAAVVLDSMSALSMIALAHALKTNGKAFDAKPSLPDYGIQVSAVQRLTTFFGAIPVTRCAVIIAHTDLEMQDDETLRQKIAIIGRKLPHQILRLFGEIWHAQVKPKPGGEHDYIWHTKPQSRVIARSQIGLDSPIPQDFEKVYRQLDKDEGGE